MALILLVDDFASNREFCPKLEEKPRGFPDKIAGSTDQMGQLVEDLLEFSRMTRAEVRKENVDLHDLFETAKSRLEPEITNRTIQWKIGSLPNVQADAALLLQVFINLMANTLKYTGPRNPAEIEIGSQTVSSDEIIIFVRDNGVGFDMEFAGKLFGVFQRLHAQDEFEGTGIGLANVRRIITRHGGRTWAEGTPGEGATFYFSLPVSAVSAK